MQFTKEQLTLFWKYEKVRGSGEFNRWDFRARRTTGLSKDQYVFVMKHYDQLREQAQAVEA